MREQDDATETVGMIEEDAVFELSCEELEEVAGGRHPFIIPLPPY